VGEPWRSCHIGDVAEVVRETINPETLGDQLVDHYSIPAYDADKQETTPASAIHSNKLHIEHDTVLVSRLNPHIPRTWWARPDGKRPALASTEFVPLRAKSLIEPAFLFQVCRSPGFFQAMIGMVTGTTGSHQRVDSSALLGIPLLLPPLSEQRAIAEVLGALDDKIEANRRQVQCLLNLIRADWHLRFCEGKDQWPELPIGEVCGVVGGSTPRTTVQEYWDGNIAWATPKDLSRLSSPPLLDTERRITELGLRQISSGLLPRGTVLLSSRAPIGYLAIAELPVAVNQGFIALVPSERLPGLYLWQWLANNLDEITTRANGTTFLEVSKANFRPMPVPIPPEEELAVWFKVAEPMYQLIVTKEVENGKLIEVRDTLLPKLLSGELRVRDAESLVETTL
jgi:type I restriction enzyme S subunit